jgi:uncharacterized membrane protein
MSSAISRRAAAAAAAAGAAVLALAGGTVAAQASVTPAHATHYTFRTLDNSNDPTFNELLGINDHGKLAGGFGAATAGHPSRGYVLRSPYRQVDYRNQNFPHARQSLVNGLNNNGVTVGIYSTQKPPMTPGEVSTFGFYAVNGKHFHKVNYPTKHPFSPPIDDLLGVNDQGVAVGFYLDVHGTSHGYQYNIRTGKYKIIKTGIAGSTRVSVTAINDAGSIAGYYTDSHSQVKGFFIRKKAPHLFKLSYPGASQTRPFGVSKHGEVVGTYEDNSTGTSVDHGFTWTRQGGFHAVNDPHGTAGTDLSGVNSAGDLVGDYVDAKNHTHGFLARPKK